MRKAFLIWLAQLLKVSVYFEVLPVSEHDFYGLPRDFQAMPTHMYWEGMRSAMWPKPDRRYRVFLQPD